MKKILITGCSGYIGSHLCDLLKHEYEIHGLDIVEPKVEINKFYQIDINKPFNIDGITYDAVIHLAALVNVGESQLKPISYYITNINGTMNVVNKIKTHHFIFASTGAAENCLSVYGTSKKAAEDVVKEFCTQHRSQAYTIFRFYNVIGNTIVQPTNFDGLMHNLLKAKETGEITIHGNDYETPDGTCIRDYVHVNEICNAIKLAINRPANNIECLGHGVGYSVKEIVEIFESVNNLDITINYGPKREGDLPVSVLENVSPYMQHVYSIQDLLKITNDV